MPLHPTLSFLRSAACALLLTGLAAFAFAAGKGDVNDLFAAGGNVTVDRPVTGDAFVAGGTVQVRAPVSDRLRVAGGEVLVDSTIGGKLTVFGGKITIGPDAVIGGDARLFGGQATIDGRIEGNLSASGGQVLINGHVRGDVTARGGSVELGPEARIEGVLRYTGGQLKQADGARVVGAVVHDTERARDRNFTIRGPGRGFSFVFFAIVLVVAAVVLSVLPKFATRVAERSAGSPLSMVGLGFVTLVGVPVALVLLCVTLIGIPLAVAIAAALPVVLLVAFTLSVLGLARVLPGMFRQAAPQRLRGELAWFAVALAALLVVNTVPVLGTIVMVLFLFAGVGAFVVELPRRRSGGPAGGTPATARAVPA